MKKLVLLPALLGLFQVAQANEDIAQSNNCLACHQIDAQLVGPSYQAIAEKYQGQDGASELLIESIKNGSTGKWGAIPMPPNAHVSDEDLMSLAEWILAM